MFEYLMPLLVMPGFASTLLDQTCRAAVARQIDYGRRRGVPWGISESCYDLTDAEGNYQYHAFGVPGLGLQRGLSDDVVVSPYASALALLVDPQRACGNLRRHGPGRRASAPTASTKRSTLRPRACRPDSTARSSRRSWPITRG